MAQHSDAPVFPPFPVIGPQFVAPKPLEIIVEKYPCRNIVVTDTDHKILLKVKPHKKRFHRQRVLLDANDKPIAMMCNKKLTMHGRWNVFKGESKSGSDMILSANRERVIQFKTNLSVKLANKMRSNDGCDFRIKGSLKKGNCTIYKGDSSIVIAEVVLISLTLTAKNCIYSQINPSNIYNRLATRTETLKLCCKTAVK